jgi:hypothetical protein
MSDIRTRSAAGPSPASAIGKNAEHAPASREPCHAFTVIRVGYLSCIKDENRDGGEIPDIPPHNRSGQLWQNFD